MVSQRYYLSFVNRECTIKSTTPTLKSSLVESAAGYSLTEIF